MRTGRSIRTVMLRNFILSALVPAVLLSILLCSVSFSLMVQQAAQTNLAALELAAKNVENRLDSIVDLAVRLPAIGGTSTQMSSDSLYWLVATHDADSESIFTRSQYISYSRIRTMISQSFLQLNPYINGIYVLIPDGTALSFGGNYAIQRSHTPLIDESLKGQTLPAFVPQGLDSVYAASRSLHASYVRTSCLTYFSNILSLTTHEPIALIAIDMDNSVFDALTELSSTHCANVYAVNAEGEAFFSVCAFAQTVDEPTHNRFSGAFAEYDWRSGLIRCGYPLSCGVQLCYWTNFNLLDRLEPALLVALIASLALVLYVFGATLLNARRFSRPIVQLSEKMIANDRLPDAAALRSDIQEYRILFERYNEMLSSIASYIEQKYANEMLLIRAQMQAMEAQIDSHFLYNTLECIYTMALLDGASNVACVVKSLSDMLRYISRTEGATVSVRQELRHVQDYVAIQQARLGGSVSCVLSVNESILDRRMLKLSLQPLVENAFKHGFSSGQPPYRLYLYGELRGGMLVFSVRDNGAGMTEEALTALRRRLSEHSEGQGVGLANIANRLHIYYGDSASLTINSLPNQGTLVTMTLPEGETP